MNDSITLEGVRWRISEGEHDEENVRWLLVEVDRLRAALPIMCACGRSAEWHDANPGAGVEPIDAGPACEHGVCAGSGWYGSRWHDPDGCSPHLHCRCGADCGACAMGDGFNQSGPDATPEPEPGDG